MRKIKNRLNLIKRLCYNGCGGRTRTYDLRVMRYGFVLFAVLSSFENVIIKRFIGIVVIHGDS